MLDIPGSSGNNFTNIVLTSQSPHGLQVNHTQAQGPHAAPFVQTSAGIKRHLETSTQCMLQDSGTNRLTYISFSSMKAVYSHCLYCRGRTRALEYTLDTSGPNTVIIAMGALKSLL